MQSPPPRRTHRDGPSRRAVLGAGLVGAAALLAGCGEERAASRPRQKATRFRYGTTDDQYADLRMPEGDPLTTVVLLHGGYWLPQYLADQMVPLAEALGRLGVATWNVEYRRTGVGGGFPHTFEDVAAAVDRLTGADVPAGLADDVLLLGHSAGGHLAGWAASRSARTPGGAPKVAARGAISLSGVLQLTRAATDPRSAAPVQAFMGGSPSAYPERYQVGDPSLLVPARCPVWAVHAEDDEVVPVEQSTGYVAQATAAGGQATHVAVPGDHISIIEPDGPAFPAVRKLIVDAAK